MVRILMDIVLLRLYKLDCGIGVWDYMKLELDRIGIVLGLLGFGYWTVLMDVVLNLIKNTIRVYIEFVKGVIFMKLR